MKQPHQTSRLVYQTDYASTHAPTSVVIAEQSVADVLACWPQTASVFLRYRLACVGCPLARFDLISDVATIYGIDLDLFLNALTQAIKHSEGKPTSEVERDV